VQLEVAATLLRPLPPSTLTDINNTPQLQRGAAVDVLRLGLWCPAAIIKADSKGVSLMVQGERSKGAPSAVVFNTLTASPCMAAQSSSEASQTPASMTLALALCGLAAAAAQGTHARAGLCPMVLLCDTPAQKQSPLRPVTAVTSTAAAAAAAAAVSTPSVHSHVAGHSGRAGGQYAALQCSVEADRSCWTAVGAWECAACSVAAADVSCKWHNVAQHCQGGVIISPSKLHVTLTVAS